MPGRQNGVCCSPDAQGWCGQRCVARLAAAQLATGVALSVLVSMGSVGLPGQAIFLATNLPVTSAMGLPIAPLPVLMAVDAIPDVLATVGNVTGDMTATAVVATRSDEPDTAG